MAKTVLEVLAETFEETRDARIQALRKGSPKDYAEYRGLVGVITGLDIALEEVKALSKNQMEEDDD